MHSTPRIPSTQVKAEEDKLEEDEAEGIQLQKTELVTVNNTQIIHITLTTLKVRGEEARDGPISPIFSVTNARSTVTMNKNAERSMQIKKVTELMYLKKKKALQRLCSSPIKQLKNIAAQIYGYQIAIATIT